MTDPRVHSISLAGHDLLGDKSWAVALSKAVAPAEAPSQQGQFRGTLPRLIDYVRAGDLKNVNVHHSTCLEAKRDAIVGLGHREQKIHDALDQYCQVSWLDVLLDACLDMIEFGNGHIEVVRDPDGNIRGIHHLPATHTWVFVEDSPGKFHFEISNTSLLTANSTLRFARFGDREDFLARRGGRELVQGTALSEDSVSEVIHLPWPSNRSRYYGYIGWSAAVPSMELDSCITQYQFDFHINGGVPDGIFSVSGAQVDETTWEKFETEFRKHIGLGNRRKVMLLNLGNPDTTAQFDSLAQDGQSEGQFKDSIDTLAMKIVSAHRVPPIIAGIQIPGKLGAANEITNAMLLFQLLAIGPLQRHISTILANTLGNPSLNGELELTADDFLAANTEDKEPDPNNPADPFAMRSKNFKGNGFYTILDEMGLKEMDTMSRMRTPMAQAGGRDLSQGLAERGGET